MLIVTRRVFLLGAGATLAALGRPAHAVSGPVTVEIKDFAFTPAQVTVPSGTEVTWVNHDEEPHTVASLDGRFRSEAMDSEQDFSFVFDRPGTYRYFCSVHPHMKGVVTVVPG